ncbi:MAG: hypothetical protein ACOX5Z_07395 [Desulfobulbus sp.]|jgi:hypothetical protein
MALVNIDTVHAETLQLLKKTDPPGGILLLSYKRNRSIAILKKEEELLEVREDGYVQQVLEFAPEKLPRELKTMIKREFPRSRKVRLIKFADPEELTREWPKI